MVGLQKRFGMGGVGRLTWQPLLAALCLLDWTSAVEISLADICGNHLVLLCSALHCIDQLSVIPLSNWNTHYY